MHVPNARISEVLSTPTSDMEVYIADPRSELDSHANMVVLDSNSFVFESTGRTCNVQPFSSDLGTATNVPIVDGALAYDCPYTGEVYILLIRNALRIPSMEHNLLPPFILRAGGVSVHDVPKIHCEDPDVNDHCISFDQSELRIPLQLNGIFSYFHSRVPTSRELHECEKIFLTPDSNDWNPHCKSYEQNERSMLDFEGNMSEPSRRSKLQAVFDDDNDEMSDLACAMATVVTTDFETNIDANISTAFVIPHSDEQYLNTSSDVTFCKAINMRGEISKFSSSIGC